MRPHGLRVTAFGAFGGTVQVNFDDLAAAGLFLLHGETGAGKTTLLDAIGFALYGRVPGVRGDAKRLRSDHADPGTPTEVELEATIGGRRVRVTRRPEQARPKKRGDGFTTEQARVLLSECLADGDWSVVSTRVGEADTEIADLMGMSAEQFFQVVLLPQGQFAQFLHANAEKRGELLQRLFGTDRFRAVEKWLAELRREATREVEDATARLGQLAARIGEAAGAAMPSDGSLPSDGLSSELAPADLAPADLALADHARADLAPAGLAVWAGRLAAGAEADAAVAAGEAGVAQDRLDVAQAGRRDAERLADRQRRRVTALRRRAELAEAEPRIGALRAELGAAQRAAEVASALAAAGDAEAALAGARAAEEKARAAVGGSVTGLVSAAELTPGESVSAAELREAGQERRQRVGQLEALRSLAERAAEEDALAATARANAERMTTEAGTCGQRITRDRARREDAATARDAAASSAAALPQARAEADRHRRAAEDAADLVKARTDADRERHAHLAARETAVGLHEEANRLREARIDGMRAELAATLVDGSPCPVCGSLDHPDLCELRGERVTREQEDEATATAESADRSAEAIGAKVTAAQTLAAALTARLDETGFGASAGLGPADLRGEAKRLDTVARELDAQARVLAATAAELTDLQAKFDALGQAIADTETRKAELGQQCAAELEKAVAADGRAEENRETLRVQLGGAPDLASALRAARTAADALTAAADAVDATARAADARIAAYAAAVRASADAGFAGMDDARDACRDVAWRSASDGAIREHEAASAAVGDQLADPELDVPLEPPADLTGALAAAEAANEVHKSAVATLARAQRRAEQLVRLLPELDGLLAEFGPLTERSAEIHRLADLANGQGANTLRMTLSSFVLAARLEEVAAAASQRLLRMTAGRYSLVHTDSRRGGGRSGLGLLACDAWTGADRDTSTLSGGETFMASLALALGLADVVTEEAGGTRIEALFVDEGFGSLDEETLEEVMNVLDGLREGGRCVGIVSHVSELRQRIPAQVRVRKGHSGSTVSVQAAALD
jgi:exonuclease SbcC